jgi:hypothetical protein
MVTRFEQIGSMIAIRRVRQKPVKAHVNYNLDQKIHTALA